MNEVHFWEVQFWVLILIEGSVGLSYIPIPERKMLEFSFKFFLMRFILIALNILVSETFLSRIDLKRSNTYILGPLSEENSQ